MDRQALEAAVWEAASYGGRLGITAGYLLSSAQVDAILAAALIDRSGVAARCPTPCDADCEQACHEVHDVPSRQEHSPETCVATIVAAAVAAERERCAAEILACAGYASSPSARAVYRDMIELAVTAAFAAEAEFARTREPDGRGHSMPPLDQVRRMIAAAAPVVQGTERTRVRQAVQPEIDRLEAVELHVQAVIMRKALELGGLMTAAEARAQSRAALRGQHKAQPHEHVFDADGDCLGCGADLFTAGRVRLSEVTEMTPRQRVARERDVPHGCPCDYIWTGLVWTRSSSWSSCGLHGGDLP